MRIEEAAIGPGAAAEAEASLAEQVSALAASIKASVDERTWAGLVQQLTGELTGEAAGEAVRRCVLPRGSGAGQDARVVAREQVSIGILIGAVHHDVVAAALAAAGVRAKRSDAKLPPQVVVYVLMGLWLFADEAYQEVCAKVTGYLDELGLWAAPWSAPTASALSQARKKVPEQVVASVFSQVAVPLAGEFTPGAFVGTFPGPTWRMLAIDGYELDVPDTAENAAAYGYATTSTTASTTTSTTASATASATASGTVRQAVAQAVARAVAQVKTGRCAPRPTPRCGWSRSLRRPPARPCT
ncbi:Insertion element 4 transposase N-terminal [Quadrisphaera granulorum]|uniref:Transposase IS4-like protein n=1 Tax=Quadrisphaera granulorum TaxID=317664 RepID=A0A316A7P8_9ACTN|nr:transposase domain-containing protein [Quadrisphaera granulorum]PWJ52844.1 transposase IS4-like protein [Quadrisphaera granulorum]SZE97449.1 Insertion element 4 transposase N-terminal [Quadrisphaera granulorum]